MTALGLPVDRVARRTGGNWVAVGSGIDNSVYALSPYKTALVAGGNFGSAGGRPCAGIAQWDGDGWGPLGSGMNGLVYALAEFSGELVAGGTFTTAGGVSVGCVAAWNGATWRAMGLGFPNVPGNPYPVIAAFGRYGGDLVAGGRFMRVEGAEGYGVARWDGQAWRPFPGTFFTWGTGGLGTVFAVSEYQDDLYVGGSFNGVPLRNIARWDGNSWSPVGSGLADGALGVASLLPFAGSLYAGGDFKFAGGKPTGGLARWDGTDWQSVGPGAAYVLGIAAAPGSLALIGDMGQSGQPPTNWGTIRCSCYPDCNGDGALNLSDFGCFTTEFALGGSYADCNGDGALNLSDFGCFQTKFALGCP
ncbi:MAG: hypothetical protein IT437_06195 [Phycisphaerales bacterium]|nr:hypothetical protein [Phycisphaerales bacterium]